MAAQVIEHPSSRYVTPRGVRSQTGRNVDACVDLALRHEWNKEDNQRWDEGTRPRTVQLIGYCPNCGSEWYQLFSVDRRNRLISRVGQRQYRYSDEFKHRDKDRTGDRIMFERWERETKPKKGS